MKGRIEVWFSNGLFRAYPKVDWMTIHRTEDNRLTFDFGPTDQIHKAEIVLDNTNFIEYMPNDEE